MLLFSRTPPRRNAGISWWSRVLPQSEGFEAAASPAPNGPAAREHIVVPDLPPPLPIGTTASTPSAPPSYAARLGRAVHRVLQWASASAEAPDYSALAAAAVAEFDLPHSAAPNAAAYAQTIRDSPALRRFFDAEQVAWSADEFDIVHDGTLLRLDRLVRFGSEHDACWWVLDYKLALAAADDAVLRQQLQRYRAAVRLLADGAPVRAAFITGDGALHELPADAAPAVE